MGVLVAGGAGYIGSVTAWALADVGADVWVIDDLSTGHAASVAGLPLIIGDVGDAAFLYHFFSTHKIDTVLHFAARSLVAESMRDPAKYFDENVGKSAVLIRQAALAGVSAFILSSTAAVYGTPQRFEPIPETAPLVPENPYGESKQSIERMLEWMDRCAGMRFVSLRYFNAAGAGRNNTLIERHLPETHLIPNVLHTALYPQEPFSLFGEDYPTPDGTCIRDYIHVDDLASAHVAAWKYLLDGGSSLVANLGNQRGFSVREVLEAAQLITGRQIPIQIMPRRPGDPPYLVADPSRAHEILDWQPLHTSLEAILTSAWEGILRAEKQPSVSHK
ncbi:MAG: UDP-glucose 4-epimerase GalE [Firmicutes bacterium]|nr:UDP-glucose 4-epimerase GalE [Bacillota bacterium]